MSATSIEAAASGASRLLNPFTNPSYPKRVHVLERAELEASLRSCDARLATIRQKLNLLGTHAQIGSYERLYHQMLGARDQVAATVRRIPGETGGLYHEDKERHEQAVAAFERVVKQWEKVTG